MRKVYMIGLLFTIVVLGIIAWFVQSYVPMSAPFKALFTVVCVIIVLFLLLNFFGLMGGTPYFGSYRRVIN